MRKRRRRKGHGVPTPTLILGSEGPGGVAAVPPRVPKFTGQPSGKRSGVHLRKSGQPRSRSTMVQGARVAWHRVWLGSSTCPSSHLGM